MTAESSGASRGKLLPFLKAISGSATLVGIHNDLKTGGPSQYTDRIQALTGRFPALWGGDFLFDGRMVKRWEMIREAERQWKAGAVVNLMWHPSPPNQGIACEWEAGILSRLSDSEWTDLVTEGGALNREWKARMDVLVPYLEYLQDRKVEVLWRPLHEMNQEKFWWGGRPGENGTARLYRITHDYLTREKGLTNLVWTWDIQDLRFDWEGYHPGQDFFDVMALDVYSMGFTDSLYRAMLRLAGDKPVGLGEVAKMPTPEDLARQPRYCFVMGWSDLVFSENSDGELIRLFQASRVVSREAMPGWDRVDDYFSSSYL